MSVGYSALGPDSTADLYEQELRAQMRARQAATARAAVADAAQSAADLLAARSGDGYCPIVARTHSTLPQWLPCESTPTLEQFRGIRAEQWGEMFSIADAAASVADQWGMESHIAMLRQDRHEFSGQRRRNWDASASAVLACATELREKHAQDKKAVAQSAQDAEERAANNPFAALASLRSAA